jgi:hypothetical protein
VKTLEATLIKLGVLASIILTYSLGIHAQMKTTGPLFVDLALEEIESLVVMQFLSFQLKLHSCHYLFYTVLFALQYQVFVLFSL